jgi:hypothetical protein
MELLSKVLVFLAINCIIIQIGAQHQYRDPFREQFENYTKKQIEFYKEEEKSKLQFFDHNFIEDISFLFPYSTEAVDLLSKFDISKIDFSNLKQLIPFFNAYEVFYVKIIFIFVFFSKFVNFFSATIP